MESGLAAAKRGRRAIGLPSLTTATSTTVARPDGTLATTTYVFPVRAKQPNGAWATLAASPTRRVARSGELIGPVTHAAVTANAVTNPASSGTGAFDEVQQGCPTSQYYNNTSTAPLGVGNENYPGTSCQGIFRSFWQINTGNLNSSMHVESATLLTAEQWASDLNCNHTWPVTVKWTGAIGPGTDWNNQPGVNGTGQTQNPKAASCGTVDVNFDVTSFMVMAAAGNWSTWTYGLYGDEAKLSDAACAPSSSYNCGFMRFNDNPSITTVFDIAPNAPTNVSLSPAPHLPGGAVDQGCHGTGSDTYGWIGRTDIGAGNGSSVTVNSTVTSNITGENVRAELTFFEATPSEANYTFPDSAYVSSGTSVGIPVGVALHDGQRYGYRVFAYDGTLHSASSSPDCYFNVDLTPPTVPVIASTDFPQSGSATSTSLRVGQTGTFTLSSNDPAPTVCAGACGASEVGKYEYSFNTPVPASGAPTLALGGTLSFTPTQWGTNILYVDAVDNAGNRSRVAQYDFYVPWNQAAKVTPGDINGDGIPDLLATSTAGSLLLYPGNTDPAAPPVVAGTKATSPDGTGWNTFQITHRGSMSQGTVDDLFAHKGANLYSYTNGGGATMQFGNTANVTSPVTKPSCVAPPGNPNGCQGYDAADWSAASQILSPGDVFRNRLPALLTVENDQLWAYEATFSDALTKPVLIGTSGWKNMTLIGPGDVGGVLTLWARDTATGNLYGYPLNLNSATGLPASLGPATGNGSAGSQIGNVTLPVATYPTLASPGDLTGSGFPGLYAEDATGHLWYYPGQSTSGGTSPLAGVRNLFGTVDNATGQWLLTDGTGSTAADASGNGHNGTLSSGASWATGTARGTVASFNGSSGAITTSAPVVNTTGSYSVSGWAYLTKAGATAEIASQDGATNSAFILHVASNGNNNWAFGVNASDTSGPLLVGAVAPGTAALNTWTHVVGTYDRTDGQLDVYVNGKLAATASSPGSFATAGSFVIGRGKWLGNPVDWFPGQISDVQAFNYALTPAEVAALYQGQSPVSQLS
jgi:Concanavalin A-like lectin/glucanases superfamily